MPIAFLVRVDGRGFDASFELAGSVLADGDAAAEAVEPVLAAAVRILHVEDRAEVDACREVGVGDPLDVVNVFRGIVVVPTVNGVGQCCCVDGVSV